MKAEVALKTAKESVSRVFSNKVGGFYFMYSAPGEDLWNESPPFRKRAAAQYARRKHWLTLACEIATGGVEAIGKMPGKRGRTLRTTASLAPIFLSLEVRCGIQPAANHGPRWRAAMQRRNERRNREEARLRAKLAPPPPDPMSRARAIVKARHPRLSAAAIESLANYLVIP